MLGPFLPLCTRLGRLATALAESTGVERVEVEYLGRIAERDTRLLTIAALNGLLAGHTEEEVNFVNAPSLAEERGIEVSERKEVAARDFTDLVRVTSCQRRRARARRRHDARPPAPPAPARGLGPALQPPDGRRVPRAVPLQRRPGMIGRVGTCFGEHGVNISNAAVGRLSRATRPAAAPTSR